MPSLLHSTPHTSTHSLYKCTHYSCPLNTTYFLYRVFIIVQLYYAYVIFASYMLQFYVPMDFLEIPFFKLIRLEHHIDKLMYYRPQLHGPAYWLAQIVFRTILVSVTGNGYSICVP